MESRTLAHRPIDQLIAGLCGETAELRERCRALEDLATSRAQDAASSQLLARQAIHALHREQVAHERLRERYVRLATEYREHVRRTSLAEITRAA